MRTCCSSAPSSACSSRPTAAGAGSSSRAACRRSQIRDLAIQKRENDLVAASFGRGFYILDDYTPLRSVNDATLARDAVLFPVRKAHTYALSGSVNGADQGFFGDQFFVAPNPPLGAVFSYYLKKELKTRAKARLDAEAELEKKGADARYPSWDELRSEDREEAPAVVLTVTDVDGNVVRRISGTTKAGIQRVAWDLRYPPPEPTTLEKKERDPWDPEPVGPLVAPGTYHVALAERVDDKLVQMGEPQTFDAVPLGGETLPPADRAKLLAFQQQTGKLQRAALGAVRAAAEAQTQINFLKKALADTPAADNALRDQLRAIEVQPEGHRSRAERRHHARQAQRTDSAVDRRSHQSDRVWKLVHDRRCNDDPPPQLRNRRRRIRTGTRTAAHPDPRRPGETRNRRRSRRRTVDAGPRAGVEAVAAAPRTDWTPHSLVVEKLPPTRSGVDARDAAGEGRRRRRLLRVRKNRTLSCLPSLQTLRPGIFRNSH